MLVVVFSQQDVIQTVKAVETLGTGKSRKYYSACQSFVLVTTLSSGLAELAGERAGYVADRVLCLSPEYFGVSDTWEQKPWKELGSQRSTFPCPVVLAFAVYEFGGPSVAVVILVLYFFLYSRISQPGYFGGLSEI